ncbi:GH25 family lysozyme [Salinibacterium sp. ZJ454]|uniref:GH25 family lysozyme n=1 Tax=Salinibacterium sp. ZJ454 TaxID=2708339 RepID=UPI001FB9C327|nr:GH25 family lysozyme [Salinibacterium sp. ZJ454]
MTADPSKPRRRRIGWRGAAITASVTVLILGAFAALIASGHLWPNRIFASSHTTRGIDVSSYQGAIDWSVLSSEDIDFAIIKATEGSGAQDSRFAKNWSNAHETDLLVGAYHFMSFESEGATQAQNVIDTVPDAPGSLPVTVDLEFYGEFFDNPPTRTHVRNILDPLLAALKDHYGTPPIIYATPDAYDRYLRDDYHDNPIWIRSVALPPQLSDGRDWTIWQYSHRDRLRGYNGDEHYIDMNVFAGTLDEMRALAG